MIVDTEEVNLVDKSIDFPKVLSESSGEQKSVTDKEIETALKCMFKLEVLFKRGRSNFGDDN